MNPQNEASELRRIIQYDLPVRCADRLSHQRGRQNRAALMPNNAHDQRLSELVAFPREDLNIELKGWLSPSDETDRANIAKALLALANTGGGYLLIGFDERDGAWAPGPAAAATEFSQDVINQIVARYADPPFQCAVYQVVGQDGGPMHPVIVVPGNHRVPIRAKSEDPARKHVRIHAYYIRRPGPCSDQPRSASEWGRPHPPVYACGTRRTPRRVSAHHAARSSQPTSAHAG
jgi:hypothetical protein